MTTDDNSKGTDLLLKWKPGVVRNVAVKIVQDGVFFPGEPPEFFADQVDFADVLPCDRNTIGIAFRMLAKAGIIEQTGNYRKSHSKGSRGRVIFEYRLADHTKARTFLKENQPTVERPIQNELNLP